MPFLQLPRDKQHDKTCNRILADLKERKRCSG